MNIKVNHNDDKVSHNCVERAIKKGVLLFFFQPGVKIHYVDMGDGPPVLMCHGFPESWFSWRYQVSKNRYRVSYHSDEVKNSKNTKRKIFR